MMSKTYIITIEPLYVEADSKQGAIQNFIANHNTNDFHELVANADIEEEDNE